MSRIATSLASSPRRAVRIQRPSRRIVIRSAISKTSSIRCEMNSTATPDWRSDSTIRKSRRVSFADKRRRRLVHDQDAGVERERLGDLDGLLLGDRQAPGRLLDVELDAEPLEDRLGIALHLPAVDDPPAVAMADEDVLGDRQVGEDHRLLVDRDDPQCLRIEGARDRSRLTVDDELAGVRLLDAGHHLDQRRLAGPVLADEGVHLARVERERRTVERLGRAEAPGDAAYLDDRFGIALLVRHPSGPAVGRCRCRRNNTGATPCGSVAPVCRVAGCGQPPTLVSS